MKELPIIIKSDVQGSAEVLADTLTKLSDERVKIRIIHSGVGAINESDVLLGAASNAIIIGSTSGRTATPPSVADRDGVDIRLHSVIYNVTDEMKKAMTGLLDPTLKEVRVGAARGPRPLQDAEVRHDCRLHGHRGAHRPLGRHAGAPAARRPRSSTRGRLARSAASRTTCPRSRRASSAASASRSSTTSRSATSSRPSWSSASPRRCSAAPIQTSQRQHGPTPKRPKLPKSRIRSFGYLGVG